MLALEWPLGFIAGTALHRSLEFRLAILPLTALSAALIYQGTNPALYYLVGMIVYFWAYSEGEVRFSSLAFLIRIWLTWHTDHLCKAMDFTSTWTKRWCHSCITPKNPHSVWSPRKGSRSDTNCIYQKGENHLDSYQSSKHCSPHKSLSYLSRLLLRYEASIGVFRRLGLYTDTSPGLTPSFWWWWCRFFSGVAQRQGPSGVWDSSTGVKEPRDDRTQHLGTQTNRWELRLTSPRQGRP